MQLNIFSKDLANCSWLQQQKILYVVLANFQDFSARGQASSIVKELLFVRVMWYSVSFVIILWGHRMFMIVRRCLRWHSQVFLVQQLEQPNMEKYTWLWIQLELRTLRSSSHKLFYCSNKLSWNSGKQCSPTYTYFLLYPTTRIPRDPSSLVVHHSSFPLRGVFHLPSTHHGRLSESEHTNLSEDCTH